MGLRTLTGFLSKQSQPGFPFPFLSTQHNTIPFINHQFPIKRSIRNITACLDLYQRFCSRRYRAPPSNELQSRRIEPPHQHRASRPKTAAAQSDKAIYLLRRQSFHQQAITRLTTLLSSAGRAQDCNCIQRSIVILRPAVRSREGRHFFCAMRRLFAIDIGVARKQMRPARFLSGICNFEPDLWRAPGLFGCAC